MLDLKKIRLEATEIAAALLERNFTLDIDLIRKLDEQKRSLLQQGDEIKNTRNDYSKKVGLARKSNRDAGTVAEMLEKIRQLSSQIDTLDAEVQRTSEQLDTLLRSIPNLPSPNVPGGKKSKLERSGGTIRNFDWEPKTHLELGNDLKIRSEILFDNSTVSVYSGSGATFKRALLNFLFDTLRELGFQEFSSSQTDFLPEFYRNAVFDASALPCFCCAAEEKTGSFLCLRAFSAPGTSHDCYETILSGLTAIFEKIQLPYQVINLCAEMLEREATKTLLIETCLPSEKRFVEAVRLSHCTDYLSREWPVRYRVSAKEKPQYVHMLTGQINIDRLISVIWENNQADDGSILLPTALQTYLGTTSICKQK